MNHSRIVQSIRPRLALLGICLACGFSAVASEAEAQRVESLFISGRDAEGYYVPSSGVGKLDVAALADLANERPVTLGARIEIKNHFFAEKNLTYATTTSLTIAGRQGSGGRDEWYLPVFSWIISCDPDGGTISFDGEVVGKSPVDFIIEVGVVDTSAHAEQPEEAIQLIGDSVAESAKKRVVCGKYTSLPRP